MEKNRVAVVNRWCPWWLSIDEFAPKSRFNNVCRPISKSEYLNLPKNLKPLMRQNCYEELDTFQKFKLKKAKAAAERTRWAYQKVKKSLWIIEYKFKNLKLKLKINKLDEKINYDQENHRFAFIILEAKVVVLIFLYYQNLKKKLIILFMMPTKIV